MRVVDEDRADLIALGRSLIADPEWVLKAQSAKPIRRCLWCNACVDGMRAGDPLRCVVNPAAARELDYASSHLPQGERIAVHVSSERPGPGVDTPADLEALDGHAAGDVSPPGHSG